MDPADAIPERMRIDDLARRAGVATTTIRLYQNRGLLPPPTLVGRTGWYAASHLERLATIARLQAEGFSLAGIGRLLDAWDHGTGLARVLGADETVAAALGAPRSITLPLDELYARFPAGSLDAEQVQRAAALGLIEPLDDGMVRVVDERFLDTGATLIGRGVPASVVLDQWEHLSGIAADLATRFAELFAEHVLPAGWDDELHPARVRELAADLATLRDSAATIVAAALDRAVTAEAARRFDELAISPRSGSSTSVGG